MKVTIVNRSDRTGGAAVVSLRLLEALRAVGVDARMLVVEKLSDSPFVAVAASPLRIKSAFLRERLSIFLANGLSRKTLFQIDTADVGLNLWRHPWIREADVVCLNWINQGMLSIDGIRRIASLGKPVVWTMHDMWNMTGVCHHAGECRRFLHSCGDCPLLGPRAAPSDISHFVWERKRRLYADTPIHFVAVSNWLASKARESALLRDADISVIPNAFPLLPMPDGTRDTSPDTLTLVMGAARIDDPVKGFPILVEATRILRDRYPDVAARLRLLTFGTVRDPRLFDEIAIPHSHLGPISPEEVRRHMLASHIVVSSSLYETLPGTLIEGEAAGCVPVAFDRGGQSDIIVHLETGYLARFGDSPADAAISLAEGIVWAAGRPESLRPRLVADVERRFAAQAVARRYLSLFRSLTDK